MTGLLHMIANGIQVGTLEQTNGGALRLTVPPISGVPRLSLAFEPSDDPIPQRAARAYIEGILPDGERIRQRLADHFKVSPRSPFKLIQAIGHDCPGAVQFFTNEQLENPRTDELEPVSDAEIAARLRAFRTRDPGPAAVTGGTFSLAGAQDKMALRVEAGEWCDAYGMEPTTHIIKPGVLDISSQALMEHVSLRTLKLLGMNVAETHYLHFEDEPAIVVTRYDRVTDADDGSVRRAHQEDFCQATSIFPSEKYDVTSETVVRVLREHGAPVDDVATFVQSVLANWTLGATDAHGKNYSVLLEPDGVTLAPLYDVSTQFGLNGEWEEKVAMGIGGRKEFSAITRHHVEKFADQIGVPRDPVVKDAVLLARLTPAAFATACEEVDATPDERVVLERAHDELVEHSKQTLRLLEA